MEEVKLEVELRDQVGSRQVKKIRSEELIPAIVYGGDRGPTTVKVNRRAFEKIMRQHRGQSVVFHLDVMQDGKKLRDYSAIVKDEQLHPVKDNLLHLDFQRIALDEELEVNVQIEIKGEAVGVKKDGGSLDQHIRELDVVCLPTSIPQKIFVDVSELSIGEAVHVSDVALPAGVKTNHDPQAVIVSVVPPMREEAVGEGDDDQEPEVISDKKKEEAKEGDSSGEASTEEKSG